MYNFISSLYSRTVLTNPIPIIIVLTIMLTGMAWFIKDFKLDASADSLLLENDEDLRIFRETTERYQAADFLFVSFTPKEDLFSDTSIKHIVNLREELKQLEQVESVITIADVPLVKQVDAGLTEIAKNFRTLEQEDIDRRKAKQELINSPIFKELNINLDGTTTALQVNLKTDEHFRAVLNQRNRLLLQKAKGDFSFGSQEVLDKVLAEYDLAKQTFDANNRENIAKVREIIKPYKQYGEVHLGGVAMIADDMITFIGNDLVNFGVGVFLFLVAMLSFIFRQARWVFLPLLSCIFSGAFMLGFLGFMGWKVTVISSNFISLMMIITMSMNVHLIVRYRQLRSDFPDLEQFELVKQTTNKMVWPCLYTALTTIIAFSSLVFSGIKPVIDFGWMMTIGLVVAFITSFCLFPAVLMLLGKSQPTTNDDEQFQITNVFAGVTAKYGNGVLITALTLAVISGIGISRLKVENSFINYFSEKTEIYKGLKLIDEELGGTTPLDILIRFDERVEEQDEFADEFEEGFADDDFASEDAEFDEFEDFESSGEKSNPNSTWLTLDRVETIKEVHDYLDSLPAVGKVLSLASVIRVGEEINKAEFSSIELAIIYKNLPDILKDAMFDPYVSFDDNEARISIRIRDSLKDLRRKELLEQINNELTTKLGLEEDKVQVTGVMVLYNNMLQSLFDSQIKTLGVVMIGIALMLLILFRSFTLAVIGIVPNILAAAIILGLMGLLDIPLDMMTITIAAITIGIAVDNAIHYIYRFREEYPRFNGDYIETMKYCHANIGKAVFYTAITIIVGFSILVLSNFIPSIYFGLLTALAMLIALAAALTLLPRLIVLLKPF